MLYFSLKGPEDIQIQMFVLQSPVGKKYICKGVFEGLQSTFVRF